MVCTIATLRLLRSAAVTALVPFGAVGLLIACGGGTPAAQERNPGAATVVPQPVAQPRPVAQPQPASQTQPAPPVAAAADLVPPGVVIPDELPMASSIPAREELVANGSFAPDFKLPRLDKAGGTFQLSDYVHPQGTGKSDGAIVAFMASWCGVCHRSLPTLKQIKDEHGDRLLIVIVSTDETPEAARLEAEKVAEAGLGSLPVVHADRAVLNAWLGAGSGVPRFFFLNKIGEVIVRDVGFGSKVGPLMPKQARFVLNNPQYVPR